MTYEKADAVVIRSWDYSETSRILSFYTRQFGRMSALAKGAKRKSSRVVGQVDLLTHCEIVFAAGGRSRERLHILAEAEALDTFPRIRLELTRFYAACHAAELLGYMTAVEDPNAALFDRLLELLLRLDAGVDPRLALFAFEASLLVAGGFMPELAACISCGKRSREKSVSFSASRGGVLCPDCAPGEPDRVDGLPSGALGLLDRLARGKLTRLERVRLSGDIARHARTFLDRYETFVTGREFRTAGRCDAPESDRRRR